MSEPIPFYEIWLYAFLGSATLLSLIGGLWAIGSIIAGGRDADK